MRILKNCRAALREGGRVVTGDLLVPEFDALFAAAGLRRTKVTPAGDYAVIEAVPA